MPCTTTDPRRRSWPRDCAVSSSSGPGTRGSPPDTTDDIGLASYEAMANAVTHAYPYGTIGPLELHARLVPGWVVVTVTDHGRRPDQPRAGYGLELIRRLSDDAEVVRGDYGTTVRMSWP